MPANEFEKKVQETLDDFRVKPSEEVWSRVALQISNDKRRRRGFIWLSFLFLVLGSAAYLSIDRFYLNSPSKISAQKANSEKNADANIPDTKEQTANSVSKSSGQTQETSSVNKNRASKKEGTYNSNQGTSSVKNKELHQRKAISQSGDNDDKQIQRSSISDLLISKNSNLKKSNNQNLLTNYKKNGKKELNNKFSENPSKQSAASNINKGSGGEVVAAENANNQSTDPNEISRAQDQKQNELSQQKTDSKTENSVVAKENPKTESKTSKIHTPNKWTIGVTAGVGASETANTLFPSGKSASDLYYSNNISNSLSGPYFQGYMYDSSYRKPGISWQLGISLKRKLGNRTAVSIGVNYHQYSYYSHVGARVDSSIIFSGYSSLVSAASYYRGNGSEEYKNKFGYLELPLGFAYRFNRNENFPIVGEGSLALGFALHSNQLTHSFTQNLFYHDDNAIDKIAYSFGLGLKFGILNKSQTPILIGPKFQYALNDLLKNSGDNKQHMWYLGVEGNISLWNFGGTQRRANK